MNNNGDPYWNNYSLGMGQPDPNFLPQHSMGSSQSSMHPNDPIAWNSTTIQPSQFQMQPTTGPMSSGNMGSSQGPIQPMDPASITLSTPLPTPQNQLYAEELHRQKQRILMKQKYHQMTEPERQEFNRRNRLCSYGINPNTTHLSFDDELQIVEAKARQAAAAREKYHAMTPEERKAFNERRKKQRIQKKQDEEAIFSVPLEEATPEQQEKAQEIIEKKAKIAENLHARYEAKTKPERKVKSWHNLIQNAIANPKKLEKLTEEERESRRSARATKRYYERKEQDRIDIKQRMEERYDPDSDSSLEIIEDEPVAGNPDPSTGSQEATENYKEFLENLNKKEAEAARKARRNETAKIRYHRKMAKRKEELNGREKEQEAPSQRATSSETVDVSEDRQLSQNSPSPPNSDFDDFFDDFDRDECQKRRYAAATSERWLKIPVPVRKELNKKHYKSQKERHRNMNPEERKAFNRKRSEREKRQRLQENELLGSEFAEITPQELAKAQKIVNKRDEKSEKARLRYSQMTYEQKLKQFERRKELKRIQKEKEKQKIEEEFGSILDLGLMPVTSNDNETSYEDKFLNSILNNS